MILQLTAFTIAWNCAIQILHLFDNLQLNNESIIAEQEKEFEEEDGVIVDPGFTTPSEFFSQTEEPETTWSCQLLHSLCCIYFKPQGWKLALYIPDFLSTQLSNLEDRIHESFAISQAFKY